MKSVKLSWIVVLMAVIFVGPGLKAELESTDTSMATCEPPEVDPVVDVNVGLNNGIWEIEVITTTIDSEAGTKSIDRTFEGSKSVGPGPIRDEGGWITSLGCEIDKVGGTGLELYNWNYETCDWTPYSDYYEEETIHYGVKLDHDPHMLVVDGKKKTLIKSWMEGDAKYSQHTTEDDFAEAYSDFSMAVVLNFFEDSYKSRFKVATGKEPICEANDDRAPFAHTGIFCSEHDIRAYVYPSITSWVPPECTIGVVVDFRNSVLDPKSKAFVLPKTFPWFAVEAPKPGDYPGNEGDGGDDAGGDDPPETSTETD